MNKKKRTEKSSVYALWVLLFYMGCVMAVVSGRAEASVGDGPGGFRCVEDPRVSCPDQTIFFRIRQCADIIRSKGIWQGRFDFGNWPVYLVHWDGKRADRGYLLNPPVKIHGAKRLSPDVSHGMTVYRYDRKLKAAQKTENAYFEVQFDIEGVPFFLMLYTDRDITLMEDPSSEDERWLWLNMLVHESFHGYQLNWVFSADFTQDMENYPITEEVLTYSLLELKILSAAVKTDDRQKHEEFLKMFLAARSEKIRIDPSAAQLVKNMGNQQEHLEGSADYFEIKMCEQLDASCVQRNYELNIDIYVFQNYLESQMEVRDFFAFGMWYSTGGILLRTFENVSIPFIRKMEEGITPYDILQGFYRLSGRELNDYLVRSKKMFRFPDLVKQSRSFLLKK